MKIDFSKHALKMLHQRNIDKSIVLETLENPDEIFFENGKKIYQSIIIENNERFLLRSNDDKIKYTMWRSNFSY